MIEEAFERAKDKKVLFVGENIEDEYVYVEPLYKPSKETILAVHEVGGERFVGGVIAAARHLDGWCQTRAVYQHLPVKKKRYVQTGFNRKLFETYSGHMVSVGRIFRSTLDQAMRDSDIVVVLDFGHGLLGVEEREVLQGAKFLAVNAQSNAGNWGFNPVTKYKTADYVCVDYQEARFAVGDQWGPLEGIIDKICDQMDTDNVIVTEGSRGASWRGGHIPALETHPLDTMGAGDCFMAYTAPLIACGLPLPDAALVGCVAASIKTGIVGHRRSVHWDEVVWQVRNELSARHGKVAAQG